MYAVCRMVRVIVAVCVMVCYVVYGVQCVLIGCLCCCGSDVSEYVDDSHFDSMYQTANAKVNKKKNKFKTSKR